MVRFTVVTNTVPVRGAARRPGGVMRRGRLRCGGAAWPDTAAERFIPAARRFVTITLSGAAALPKHGAGI